MVVCCFFVSYFFCRHVWKHRFISRPTQMATIYKTKCNRMKKNSNSQHQPVSCTNIWRKKSRIDGLLRHFGEYVFSSLLLFRTHISRYMLVCVIWTELVKGYSLLSFPLFSVIFFRRLMILMWCFFFVFPKRKKHPISVQLQLQYVTNGSMYVTRSQIYTLCFWNICKKAEYTHLTGMRDRKRQRANICKRKRDKLTNGRKK